MSVSASVASLTTFLVCSQTELSTTTANMAKYAGWHGLVLSKEHNPHKLSHDMIEDMLLVSLEWFQRASEAGICCQSFLTTCAAPLLTVCYVQIVRRQSLSQKPQLCSHLSANLQQRKPPLLNLPLQRSGPARLRQLLKLPQLLKLLHRRQMVRLPLRQRQRPPLPLRPPPPLRVPPPLTRSQSRSRKETVRRQRRQTSQQCHQALRPGPPKRPGACLSLRIRILDNCALTSCGTFCPKVAPVKCTRISRSDNASCRCLFPLCHRLFAAAVANG